MLLRRELLLMAAGAIGTRFCDQADEGTPPLALSAPATGRTPDVLSWNLGDQSWGAAAAAVIVPRVPKGVRLPLLIALHGRGESVKPPASGALGWPRDYALVRAFERLEAPPLTGADLENLADEAYLAELNQRVRRHPFRGVVVACPHLPDFDARDEGHVKEYEHFLHSVLIPRVRAECPVVQSATATGIDGVSLGGAFALRIGLRSPHLFGSVGGIQPALRERDVGELTALAQGARHANRALSLQLITSDGDYFREAVELLSHSWESVHVAHRFACAPGPHDYVFNRGPGAYELLCFHDSALARV